MDFYAQYKPHTYHFKVPVLCQFRLVPQRLNSSELNT